MSVSSRSLLDTGRLQLTLLGLAMVACVTPTESTASGRVTVSLVESSIMAGDAVRAVIENTGDLPVSYNACTATLQILVVSWRDVPVSGPNCADLLTVLKSGVSEEVLLGRGPLPTSIAPGSLARYRIDDLRSFDGQVLSTKVRTTPIFTVVRR